jgi:DNA-binding beta-propeller fold protein YncE
VAWAATASLAAAADGTIGTLAGIPDFPTFLGDGGAAVQAALSYPTGVAVMRDGSVLIADQDNERIRRVSPAGRITTVAGTGEFGGGGDGAAATAAALASPYGVAALPDGGFLIADTFNNRIRRVRPDGVIVTVAGGGAAGFAGDGGPATAALLDRPHGVAPTADGGFLIADTYNNRVRRVGPRGRIRTVAGTGTFGGRGDGAAAIRAALNLPTGVAPAGGGFLIADHGNNRVRRVGADGIIRTLAGSAAGLAAPFAIAPAPDGSFVVSDQDNARIRRIAPDGTITTVGRGAVAAGDELVVPFGVAVNRDGDVIVADAARQQVRVIDADLSPRRRVGARIVRAWRAGGAVHVRFGLVRPSRVTLVVRSASGARRVAPARRLPAGGHTVRLPALPGPASVTLSAGSGPSSVTVRARVTG